MTAQILLIFSFFVTGIMLQFCLKKRAPLWFLLPSAFFWGALNWALLTLLSVLMLQRVSLVFLLTFNGGEILLLLVCILTSRPLSLGRREWGLVSLYAGFFMVFTTVFSYINLSRVSPDSLFLLKMADQIADSGFTRLTWTSPAAYGYFTSLIQAVASSLALDYLYLFQPVLTVNFIVLIFFTIQHFTACISRTWLRVMLGLTAVTFLFTSTMMRFQFAYIHTNLPSAAFLFTGVVALLQLTRTREEFWLVYAMAGLTGFGITRTENPLLLLLFLGLFLSISGTTWSQRMRIILPALAVVLSTLMVTLFIDTARVDTQLSLQLPDAIIIGMIAVYVLFMAFLLISRVRWINEMVIPNFHKLLFFAIVTAFILAFVLNPLNILTSMRSIFSATMLTGGWDSSWLTIVALLVLLLIYYRQHLVKQPAGILGMSLLLYFLAILLMSLYRAPYHPQWNDSANRMFTQLLPLFVLFIVLSLEQVIRTDLKAQEKAASLPENSEPVLTTPPASS